MIAVGGSPSFLGVSVLALTCRPGPSRSRVSSELCENEGALPPTKPITWRLGGVEVLVRSAQRVYVFPPAPGFLNHLLRRVISVGGHRRPVLEQTYLLPGGRFSGHSSDPCYQI